MLLRNRRSRAMNKPNLISDHHNHQNNSQSPKTNYDEKKTTIPSLFCSLPKLRDFTMKCLSGIEALPSPTSILDTKTVLSPLRDNIPFSYENNISPRILHSSNKNKTRNYSKERIGLALVGTLKDDDPIHHNHHENTGNNNNNNNILFGTQLRVKTNNNNNNNNNSNKGCCSYSCCCSSSSESSFVMMNLSEMELSEEYTCVTTHNGPNPRKTHIFVDNCIVETYYSSPSSSSSSTIASLNNFLSFCYTCKKHLEHTKDIFIYRGDKAFCCEECRHKEMVLDGAAENL